MSPREAQFDYINRSCVEFRGGHGIREVYRQQFGRLPVFNTRTRSWVTTPTRAADFVALLESRNWFVTYSARPEADLHRGDDLDLDQPDIEEPALW